MTDTVHTVELPVGLLLIDLPEAWALLPLLILWIWCLVDVVQTDERLVRTLSKQQWIFMVVLVNVIGGLMWLMLGRPYRR